MNSNSLQTKKDNGSEKALHRVTTCLTDSQYRHVMAISQRGYPVSEVIRSIVNFDMSSTKQQK